MSRYAADINRMADHVNRLEARAKQAEQARDKLAEALRKIEDKTCQKAIYEVARAALTQAGLGEGE